MFPSMSHLFLSWRGAKVYSQIGWEPWPDFSPPWIRPWVGVLIIAEFARGTGGTEISALAVILIPNLSTDCSAH